MGWKQLASLAALFWMTQALAQDAETLVLTELPPLYSITASLAAGTGIVVENIPGDGRRMNGLGRYLERPTAADLALFKRADAVVTIGKLWREAPLYASVRAQNIRVVNIDATEPYSATLPGIALIREAAPRAPWDKTKSSDGASLAASVYCWLSPSNGIRMAEIIAQDLARLAPADAERVSHNLVAYTRTLLALKSEYEAKFAALGELSLFALSADFAYLIADMGLYADGAFIKQDIEWTREDVRHLRDYLRERRIAVVIHKWQPSAPILSAIREGGAALAVLTTAEDGVVRDGALSAAGFVDELRANLESIHRAAQAATQ